MAATELGLSEEDAEFLSKQSRVFNDDVCAWLAQQWIAELQEFPWFAKYQNFKPLTEIVARDLMAIFSGDFAEVLHRSKRQAEILVQQPDLTHAEFFKATDRLESLIRSFSIQSYTEPDEQAVALAVIQKGIRSLEFIYIEEFQLYHDRLINEKNEKTRVMFESLEEGVFLVNQQLRIEPVYSNYLDTIFQMPPLSFANQDLESAIIQNLSIAKETRDLALDVLRTTLDQESLAFDANRDNLFTKASWTTSKGNVHHLSFKWSGLIDPKTNLIHKIMVVIRDETELITLTERAKTQQQELEMISHIIELTESRFQAFMQHFLQEMDRVHDLARDPTQNLFAMRRILHTLKGSSRTLGLNRLSGEIHELENLLEKNENPALITLDAVIMTAHDYLRVARVKLGRSTASSPDKSRQDLAVFLENRVFPSLNHKDQRRLRTELESLLHALSDPDSMTLPRILSEEVKASQKLARHLKKAAVEVRFEGERIEFVKTIEVALKSAFTHILTNAIDHGIETAEDRLRLKKPEQATIHITSALEQGRLRISIVDDGQGLDLKSIRDKARNQGIDTEAHDDGQIANLILRQGISTKNEVTSESGRGVGLDAVSEEVRALGGELKVVLLAKPPHPLKANFTAFQLELLLPARCWVSRNLNKAS